MRYYAVGHVVVVEATDAQAAFDKARPVGENALSEDGEAYIGVVFSGSACPITPAMAGDPDWTVELYYGDPDGLPLMDGDDQ